MTTSMTTPQVAADGTTTEPVKQDVSERQAREVAEAARESEWTRPSFAKELYLGRFDVSLISPYPRVPIADEERGNAFLAELRECCAAMDGLRIEREAKIPDEYIRALSGIGVFGMKIPTQYGGLGLSMYYYGRALMLIGSVHPSMGALVSAHQSIGVPEPVKMFGDERQKTYVQSGWNVTGDTYREDEDGYFWYLARSDDMIISSGYNIAAPEVENALLSHPAVQECGVVGVPCEERGQRVKAFIVCAATHRPGDALADELQRHVKAVIAPYKYPRSIEFVEELPKTATGKLQRHALRAQTPLA